MPVGRGAANVNGRTGLLKKVSLKFLMKLILTKLHEELGIREFHELQ